MLDKDISGAPVVDHEGHLKGLLTENELIWKVSADLRQHSMLSVSDCITV